MFLCEEWRVCECGGMCGSLGVYDRMCVDVVDICIVVSSVCECGGCVEVWMCMCGCVRM